MISPVIVDVKANTIRCQVEVLIRTDPCDELILHSRQIGGQWGSVDQVSNVPGGHMQLSDIENALWGIYEPVEYMATAWRDGACTHSELFRYDTSALLD